jgi:hypothetical protein
MAGASAGLLVAVIRRPGPATVNILADLFILIPAIVEIFA